MLPTPAVSPLPNSTPIGLPASQVGVLNLNLAVLRYIKVEPKDLDPNWTDDLKSQLFTLVKHLNRRIEKKEKGAYNVTKKTSSTIYGTDERLVNFLKTHKHIYNYKEYSPKSSGPVFLSIYITIEDMFTNQND